MHRQAVVALVLAALLGSTGRAEGHLTVWTNLSVPVLTFDVYLTGFDQQLISLRDVLVFGNLPRTGL